MEQPLVSLSHQLNCHYHRQINIHVHLLCKLHTTYLCQAYVPIQHVPPLALAIFGFVYGHLSCLSSLLLGGEDYFVLDGIRVVFPPGVFSQTVTLNTITDVPAEGNEDLDAVLGVTDTRVGIFEPTANVIITEESRKTAL